MTTGSAYDALRRVALDGTSSEASRVRAVRQLAATTSRAAVDVLIELGERHDESESLLREAGTGLSGLLASGVEVSEWDVRDLAPAAAEGFFE